MKSVLELHDAIVMGALSSLRSQPTADAFPCIRPPGQFHAKAAATYSERGWRQANYDVQFFFHKPSETLERGFCPSVNTSHQSIDGRAAISRSWCCDACVCCRLIKHGTSEKAGLEARSVPAGCTAAERESGRLRLSKNCSDAPGTAVRLDNPDPCTPPLRIQNAMFVN
ncbi:hypothetical protein BDN70DRAFT_49529 [Pholiota conissans]|uniref:Uncharacterized protein n=1 Tax=Pholiota conissans TaxID=109636 RepID=A0A9P6CTE2_9AGAR|nr:hypothetical protein BDN70DRAFT_49529 [Pholiota conissans]